MLGTMSEGPRSDGRVYASCVVVGPRCGDGEPSILGVYRKRAVLSGAQVPGDGPVLIETGTAGKIAVLVCYDIENDGMVDDSIDLGPPGTPAMLLNPAYVPAPGRSSTAMTDDMRWNAWRTATSSAERRLSWLARTRGIPIVRADAAAPRGCGSSMVVCSDWTAFSRGPAPGHFVIDVPVLSTGDETAARAARARALGRAIVLEADATRCRVRTEPVDSVGSRYMRWPLKLGEDGGTGKDITALTFVEAAGTLKGLLVGLVCHDAGAVALVGWCVATMARVAVREIASSDSPECSWSLVTGGRDNDLVIAVDGEGTATGVWVFRDRSFADVGGVEGAPCIGSSTGASCVTSAKVTPDGIRVSVPPSGSDGCEADIFAPATEGDAVVPTFSIRQKRGDSWHTLHEVCMEKRVTALALDTRPGKGTGILAVGCTGGKGVTLFRWEQNRETRTLREMLPTAPTK